jgi:hypothetical protein
LSEGRVVSLKEGDGPGADRALTITSLAGGATRSLVTFTGTAGVGGFALSGNSLAWEQRSSVVERTPHGCGTVFLSQPQLASIDVRTLGGGPVSVPGVDAGPHQGCPYAFP